MCSAHAQSTVTLYGRVASGLDFVTHAAQPDGTTTNNFRFGSNQYGISWWGLTGSEDLGAGLKTVFKLESSFTAGTGQVGDSLFNRYAYVGLSSDKYGSLWMGRAMSLTDETGWYLDPMGEQITGVGNFAKGRAWGSRANTVTYNSLTYGGFSFRLQRGFGNLAGNFRGNTSTSVSAAYLPLESLSFYGVYEEIRDPNGKLSSLYSASREYMAGATYVWNSLKFYAGYQQLVSSGTDTIAEPNNPTAATRTNQEWVGLNYQATSALQLEAAVYHANVNHDGGQGTLGVLGANYSLSKRTLLYSTLGMMFNHGNAAFPVETYDAGPLPGHNQQGFYVGMMHFF